MRYIALAGILLLLQVAKAQLRADSVALLEDRLSFWNNETPGGVLSMARDGQVIYQKAFGLSDLERMRPNELNTLFEAGSVSKQFTAATVLKLILDKKLALGDDIRNYIPELPDYGDPVTVYHLLTHTSGIKDWGTVAWMGGWPRTTRVYTQQHVYDIIFRQESLNFKPGSAFAYSNSNHNLMVLLVERITGRSFTEFTQTEIFDPVGMSHTRWRTNFREVVPGRAVAYRKLEEKYEQFMPFENTFGHAALLTTTEDLIRWNQWMADRKWGAAFEHLRRLPYKLDNGKTTEYTCGALFVREIGGKLEVCHTGSTAGYRSWLAYYPELNLSVAYLSNDASVPSIAIARLVSDIFVQAHPVGLPMEDNPARIQTDGSGAGMYKRIDGPQVLEWVKRGDSLYLSRDPEWNGMYNDPWKSGTRVFRFIEGEIKVESPFGIHRYRKVQPIALSDACLSGLPGAYFSKEAGGKVMLTWSESENTFIMRFESGQQISFVDAFLDAGRVSLIAENNIILTLLPGDTGKVSGFTASLSQQGFAMSRADRLIFERQ